MTIYKQYQVKKEDKKKFISLKKEFAEFFVKSLPYSKCNLSDVDKTLIPIIKKLNKLGFKTSACCSGLFSEHNIKSKYNFQDFKNSKNKTDKRDGGFIFFDFLSNKIKIKIKKIAEKSGLIFKIRKYYINEVAINRTFYDCKMGDLRCRVLNPIPYRKKIKPKDIELKDKIMLKKWNKFYKELEKLK